MAESIKPRLSKRTMVTTWPMNLAEGSVVMRRCDLMNEILAGKLETALLDHAVKLENLNRELDPLDAVHQLTDAERADTLYLFRRFACVAVQEPVLVMEDDGDPEHVVVSSLSNRDLLTIWNAVPPPHVLPDPEQALVAPVAGASAAEVERFPVSAPPLDLAEESLGADRPPVENIEVQTLRAADDRLVEYAQA